MSKEEVDRGGAKGINDFIYKKTVPFVAEWGPALILHPGVKAAASTVGEIWKRMSTNYDNPKYTFEQAVKDSLLPLGIKLTGDYTAEHVAEILAKHYKLSEAGKTLIKIAITSGVEAGVEAVNKEVNK